MRYAVEKQKHMKAYLFILLICPVMLFAQSQQAQSGNGATDCPTFGKKNNFSKAGLFQYMRTHKPQRTPDTREQQAVYRPSALPDLEQAQRERDLAMKNQNREKAAPRKQRKERNKPVLAEEPEEEAAPATKAVAKADPVKEISKKPVVADSNADQPVASKDDKGASVKEESSPAEDSGDAAREKREKKIKRAAFKAKMQHLFKRSKKSSRKNDQKCPSF